ncbi:hypothetical protein DFH06DRAFT_1161990 [Mycena polygramma]|nr:hypothetical protein DFH06DRAFT_1161990 [Mycena polygramma]
MSTSTPTLAVSLTVMGLFPLRDRNRIEIVKSSSDSTTTVYYQQYLTAIACLNGQRIPATLRVYSPHGDHGLPDNSLAVALRHYLFLEANHQRRTKWCMIFVLNVLLRSPPLTNIRCTVWLKLGSNLWRPYFPRSNPIQNILINEYLSSPADHCPHLSCT